MGMNSWPLPWKKMKREVQPCSSLWNLPAPQAWEATTPLDRNPHNHSVPSPLPRGVNHGKEDPQEAAGGICTRGAGVLQSAPDLRERGHGPFKGQEEPSSSASEAMAVKKSKEPFSFMAKGEQCLSCVD